MKRTHVGEQVVIQHARTATWSVKSQRPRHARYDVVLDHRAGRRATHVDSKIPVDRETVDGDILTVHQIEGCRA